jgi:hypothetical protein
MTRQDILDTSVDYGGEVTGKRTSPLPFFIGLAHTFRFITLEG